MPNDHRRHFAEEIELAANLRSAALVDAFAVVPRESFLPPGPWQVLTLNPMTGEASYRLTRDADPRHVQHNVAIALDPLRQLNNGHPSSLAAWIDALEVGRGDRVVHVGCGSGYYTAIQATIVGESGAVLAFELDPALAESAERNLRPWPWVRVSRDGATTYELPESDAILVNAGATHVPTPWLGALAPRGRMLVPLTFSAAPDGIGMGIMVLLRRETASDPHSATSRFAARALGPVGIYPCYGARDPAANELLRAALQSPSWRRLTELRTDPHDREPDCWLHGQESCLSTRASVGEPAARN